MKPLARVRRSGAGRFVGKYLVAQTQQVVARIHVVPAWEFEDAQAETRGVIRGLTVDARHAPFDVSEETFISFS